MFGPTLRVASVKSCWVTEPQLRQHFTRCSNEPRFLPSMYETSEAETLEPNSRTGDRLSQSPPPDVRPSTFRADWMNDWAHRPPDEGTVATSAIPYIVVSPEFPRAFTHLHNTEDVNLDDLEIDANEGDKAIGHASDNGSVEQGTDGISAEASILRYLNSTTKIESSDKRTATQDTQYTASIRSCKINTQHNVASQLRPDI
jgi:hypothetical protein